MGRPRKKRKYTKKSWKWKKSDAGVIEAPADDVNQAKVSDDVNHPAHYNMGEIETINVVDDICQFYPGDEAASISHALVYISRAPHRGDRLKDLRKAQWFLNHAIGLATTKSS